MLLSLVIFFSFAEITYGYDSFEIGTGAWEGLSIREGLVVLDPTVITIIIGEDAMEIEIISSPNIEKLFAFSPPVDILFGLTTDPNHPIEVVAERIAGIVVLEDTAVEDVTDDLLATLDFTERTVKIDSNDIVVLLLNQDQEEYAMLSNIRKYPDATVRLICWRERTEIPEVTTLVLLSVGIGFLIGMMKRKQHNRSRKGGIRMKHIKTLLFALVLLPLLVGTAVAVEVRVIKKGSGDGLVLGDGITCGPVCRTDHQEGTVIHLKAVPDIDCKFVGWLVDGNPHEGIITVNEDTVVTAIFELETGSDDLLIWWYIGDTKEYATIALDEMLLFLEEREKWGVTTEEEYQAAIKEITQHFHPQAEITAQSDWEMYLKSPEPVTKDHWFNALSSIKSLKYVKYAGPVLYVDPESRSGIVVPIDKITVQYPSDYTEDQILAVEQEYGLVRVRVETYGGDTFYDYHVGEPLKAIEVANRLYESGKVKYSYPIILEQYEPLNSLPYDEYFVEQWPFNNTLLGHIGKDANIVDAWDMVDRNGNKIRGSGVVIAIVDDGVEIDHEDLKPNVEKVIVINGEPEYVRGLSHDFLEGDHNPIDNGTRHLTPSFGVHLKQFSGLSDCRETSACHGTAVAGLAGAKGFMNITGISGTAPSISLVGYRYLSDYFWTEPRVTAHALTRNKDKVDIYNNSWVTGGLFKHLKPKIVSAIKGAVDRRTGGRGGLGNIYVFGGGNSLDLNSNYRGFANSRYTITVTAISWDGTHYAIPGANLLISAPAGGTTTDRMGEKGYNIFGEPGYYVQTINNNYHDRFGGTSAASPVISGIIALILQANPELSWRDVQHILIRTARKNDPSDGDWTNNAAGYHINHKYGFGCVDATAAVEEALDWIPVSSETISKYSLSNTNLFVQGTPEGEQISDSITMPENLMTEFVEVIFDTDHQRWADLKVTLLSPFDTPSVLVEPLPSINPKFERFKLKNWPFGSVRHFGEPSQGDWKLIVEDTINNGKIGTYFNWTLKIYDTELPPYVKAVEARSGDELIYSAEWVVEEDGQLEFVEDVEPQNPSADHPLYIKIVTSEPMGWISLNLFDQDFSSKEGTRKIQKADKTGTVWEVTIDPVDFPQDDVGDENTLANVYPLTITGQDRGDLSLLPFADRSPKTLPTHPSEADWPAQPNAGDTVHQLGKILSEPFEWRLTMPFPGNCGYDFDYGGIVCTFDEGAGFILTNVSLQALRDAGVPESIIDRLQSLHGQRFATEQDFLEAVQAHLGDAHTTQYFSLIQEHAETAKGRVILHSKDVVTIDPNIQYVIIGSGGRESRTWEGTYQIPTAGSSELEVGLTWEPQEAWFPFREPDPIGQQMWCEDAPDDMPGVDTNGSTPTTKDDKGPPHAGTDTATLAWTITADPQPDTASCQVRVTWDTDAVEAQARTLTLDLQPQSLCEAFQDQSGTLEATATYPWGVANRLVYFGCHIVDEQTEYEEDLRLNGTSKYRPIPTQEKVLEPGQCRSWYKKELMFRTDPDRWPSQPPQDIPRPSSPEEGHIAVHYDCQWNEQEVSEPFCLLVYKTHHWTFTYRCPTIYVENEGRQRPVEGAWDCDKTTTRITWECGDACVYQERPGEFVLPVPVLERELTLGP